MDPRKWRSTLAGMAGVLCCLGSLAGCEMGVVLNACGGPLDIACPTDMFCKLPRGRCGNGAEGGVCTRIPDICTEIFQPVCGCDGVTYSNDCMADAAGMNVEGNGSCESDEP